MNRIEIIVTSITTLILIITLVLNLLTKDPLFVMGVQFSSTLQKGFKQIQAINIIQNLISLLCYPAFGVAVILIYFSLTKRKLTAMVYAGYAISTIFLVAVMKQWFQQSRPFWFDKDVKVLEWFCPKDFGNPSGHSVGVFVIYYPLIADITGLGAFKQGWIFLIFLSVAVPLSRVYLGAHSVNQVIFGLFLGISSMVLYKFIFQKLLYRIYWSFLTLPLRIFIVLGVMFLNLACFAFPIATFAYNSMKYPLNSTDLENLNRGCGLSHDSLHYQHKSLQSCSLIQIFFGFLYGFMALQADDMHYLLGMHSFTNYPKQALYYFLCLLAAGLPIGITVILQKFIPMDGVVKYTLSSVGLLLTGFAACWFWTRLLHILQIANLPGKLVPQQLHRRIHSP